MPEDGICWSYVINHVFLPPELPQRDDFDLDKERTICALAETYSRVYKASVCEDDKIKWSRMTMMLKSLRTTQEFEGLSGEDLRQSIGRMVNGDILALLIRCQNAGVILRRLPLAMRFEFFEVSPPAAAVIGASGKLICSYPGPAIDVPLEYVHNPIFLEELVSFLVQMNIDHLDSMATTTKANSTVEEERDTASPRYITQLLTGILRGLGTIAEPLRISKRIADDVLWKNTKIPWRRSSIWLVIRVALQTSLFEQDTAHLEYKAFMAFLLAKLLNRAVDEDIRSDVLFCMRAKVARRLYKLGEAAPDFVTRVVEEVAEKIEFVLQERWMKIQSLQAKAARWAPEELDLLGDTSLSLHNSISYIAKAIQRDSLERPRDKFRHNHKVRLCATPDFRNLNNSLLSQSLTAAPRLALADFEYLVLNTLDSWLAQNAKEESTAIIIAGCLKKYADAALICYRSNPDDLSLMLLTIFQLWVALDKVATRHCPLLLEYSPEVPQRLLEPLLLRKSEHLTALKRVQGHLLIRHRQAKSLSVFTDWQSFAVSYFEASNQHQILQKSIERDATQVWEQKTNELTQAKAKFVALRKEANSLGHETRLNDSGNFTHQKKKCRKCSLERQATQMKIAVHEWPLPDSPAMAHAVVFELQPPSAFQAWRTTTYTILHDVCLEQMQQVVNPVQPPVLLKNYTGLHKYAIQGEYPRISLASNTKSFLVTHYKTIRVRPDLKKDEVCVKNGLTLNLFDNLREAWANVSLRKSSATFHCTPQLPAESRYKVIQYAINTTSHTSNEVLSNQCDCPKDLTVQEYFAFASLRSGNRLQWLNIARELRARSLSFDREEVYTLLMQAACQIGELSEDGTWERHAELSDGEYGMVLLRELDELMTSIEANWLNTASIGIIIALTGRLLASNENGPVVEQACDLIRRARMVTHQWTRQLGQKSQQADDEKVVQEFQRRLFETAALCGSTYDVDNHHLPRLLHSKDDIAILIECSIHVCDNSPPKPADLATHLKRVLDRHTRSSHSLEAFLRSKILISAEGLDNAISAIWPAYCPGSSWDALESPNNRWFVSQTSTQYGRKSQLVHYNILEGQLLINSRSLSRLPSNIAEHTTYSRLLGQKVLDVVPTSIPGMDFATRALHFGNEIFFAYQKDTDELVIRARMGSTIYELIPSTAFTGDLPATLVNNFVHWLDLLRGEIELRPLDNMWEPCSSNSCMDVSNARRLIFRNAKSLCLLVDIHSATFRMIADSLRSLEYTHHIIVSYSPDDNFLSVDLYRLRLVFFLNSDNCLELQNISRLVVDSNQSSGTLFGLRSQLVLHQKSDAALALPRTRSILIPHGDPEITQRGHHVEVFINTGSLETVKYHEYKIDTNLCYLVGDSSLKSRLYKSYLHALTSHCLPDPLTARSGTEEALYELRSASCYSFQKLGATEEELLLRISSLTPTRTFYPRHLQVMQTVSWSKLAAIAQHHDFHILAQAITDHSRRLKSFNGCELEPEQEDLPGMKYLSQRAAFRLAAFFPAEFGGFLSCHSGDVVHMSRDLNPLPDATDEAAAFAVSSMVLNQSSNSPPRRHLLDTLKAWRYISGPSDRLKLTYSCDWLQIELKRDWISLYNLCRSTRENRNNIFRLSFVLSALAYSLPDSRSQLIPSLLAFCSRPHFGPLNPPRWEYYDLLKGSEPCRKELLDAVRECSASFSESPEAKWKAKPGENQDKLEQRQASHFNSRLDSETSLVVDELLKQWPCESPELRGNVMRSFNTQRVLSQVAPLFKSWYQNLDLSRHVLTIQTLLDDQTHVASPSLDDTADLYLITPCSDSQPESPCRSLISLEQLFKQDVHCNSEGSPFSPDTRPCASFIRSTEESLDKTTIALRSLISEFQDNDNLFYRSYGNRLDESRRSLSGQTSLPVPSRIPVQAVQWLSDHRNQCRENFHSHFVSICTSLKPKKPAEKVISLAGQWPRFNTRSLLALLALNSRSLLPNELKKRLISFSQSLLMVQRSERLLQLGIRNNLEDFYQELNNRGLEDQDAMINPDWLLVQLDSNFLVRPIQLGVARLMTSPDSGENIVLQLNMGEGKSSVIVPFAAVRLADTTKLVRVVVLKPLASQMFQLLVEKLGGLVNRRIYYMPFSRNSFKGDTRQIQAIRDLFEECMRLGGVVVVQPEHILSFKLMVMDRLLHCSTVDPVDSITINLSETLRWLETSSRDILDESDEILHVRYQLVYTVGQQQPVEDHPNRWTTIQQILCLAKARAPLVQQKHPLGIEIQERQTGSFPFIRILHPVAGAYLVSLIADGVLAGVLPNFTFASHPGCVREAVLRVITEKVVSKEDIRLVQEYYRSSGTWKGLLLLRGLLGHGILLYALKERRWRVDYGLDLRRSLLAVPYRAKDVPSLRAEFGHPDVAIILTCLSYYYSGLLDGQLEQSFDLLRKLDNPAMEYERWVNNNDSVPTVLRQLSGVNTQDPEQRRAHLFPLFHCNFVVVDFFLSQFVFPKEAKEFLHKVAASGWDIAESRTNPTTGFSGTNDNQDLLPISITQFGFPEQLSTNALVLKYLLQRENDYYICVHGPNLERPSAATYLECLVEQTPDIRVLLDVGAQILELTNCDLAKLWLSLRCEKDVLAVIFFSEDDELTVLSRDGYTEALISSPFKQQMDKCLVYLDDAHTRGTDLKLPRNSRAAVTLGPKVAKDRLVQGCMRMRKLGHGQSVIFLAPPEVDRSIREAAKKLEDTGYSIGTLDILRWTMLETCAEIQKHIPHWAEQGVSHGKRSAAWLEFSSNEHASPTVLKSSWLQPEAQTLEEMYGIVDEKNSLHTANLDNTKIRKRCEELGATWLSDTKMTEEQEREVAHEIERERQLERPPKALPARHQVHPKVRDFVKHGKIQAYSSGFVPAFQPLRQMIEFPNQNTWPSDLFTTKDFSVVIEDSMLSSTDFLRPPQWIVSSVREGRITLVAFSPDEVNVLLPAIRRSQAVHLHQYSPKVTESMKSFDGLDFYCIPPLKTRLPLAQSILLIELNMWAGQIYFPDIATYREFCQFLGVIADETTPSENESVRPDGFIHSDDRRGKTKEICPFENSPIPFLKELIAARRRGISVLYTHVGRILQCRALTEDDFKKIHW